MSEIKEVKIERPTVGQFREFLEQFDQNAELRIMDPDTCWTIETIHAFNGQYPRLGRVWLTGKYGEMRAVRRTKSPLADPE